MLLCKIACIGCGKGIVVSVSYVAKCIFCPIHHRVFLSKWSLFYSTLSIVSILQVPWFATLAATVKFLPDVLEGIHVWIYTKDSRYYNVSRHYSSRIIKLYSKSWLVALTLYFSHLPSYKFVSSIHAYGKKTKKNNGRSIFFCVGMCNIDAGKLLQHLLSSG
jgi:hypothetical protein